jgi:hypothetical protein
MSCHQDTFKMSELQISSSITYGTYGLKNRAGLVLKREIVWPLLRKNKTESGNTHEPWSSKFEKEVSPHFWLDGKELRDENVLRFRHRDGMLVIESALGAKGEIALKRTLFPSSDKPAYIEEYVFTNIGAKPVKFRAAAVPKKYISDAKSSFNDTYIFEAQFEEIPETTFAPGASLSSALIIKSWRADVPRPGLDVADEKARRATLVRDWRENLRLETPDAVLNTAFSFAKIRAAERISELATQDSFGALHGARDAAYYASYFISERGRESFFGAKGDGAKLHALREMFFAGETARGLEALSQYSRLRLLGEHVPYPDSEGGRFSEVSILYCRVFTEGLFGIRSVDTRARAFECAPRLPQGWPAMALRRVYAFGQVFDLEISRAVGPGKIRVRVTPVGKTPWERTINEGETARVEF